MDRRSFLTATVLWLPRLCPHVRGTGPAERQRGARDSRPEGPLSHRTRRLFLSTGAPVEGDDLRGSDPRRGRDGNRRHRHDRVLAARDDRRRLCCRSGALAYRNRVEIYSIGTRVRLAQPTPIFAKSSWSSCASGSTSRRSWAPRTSACSAATKPDGRDARSGDRLWRPRRSSAAPNSPARAASILGVEDDGGITDFAKETIEIVTRANSPWAGMNLDIGNFKPPKVLRPDRDVDSLCGQHPHQDRVAQDDGKTKVPFDWDRVFGMFAQHGYRGYMGLEYEANDDANDGGARASAAAEGTGAEVFRLTGLSRHKREGFQ